MLNLSWNIHCPKDLGSDAFSLLSIFIEVTHKESRLKDQTARQRIHYSTALVNEFDSSVLFIYNPRYLSLFTLHAVSISGSIMGVYLPCSEMHGFFASRCIRDDFLDFLVKGEWLVLSRLRSQFECLETNKTFEGRAVSYQVIKDAFIQLPFLWTALP